MTFDYPETREHRRHGPQGYANYSDYRPWLRDDFSFRCVYCLWRECWALNLGAFHFDHFQSQSRQPDRALDYENLFYSCHSCNLAKGGRNVPDPFTALTASGVKSLPDGTLEGTDPRAREIIDAMKLNSRDYVDKRILMMRVVELARERDPDVLKRLLGFPIDLPDLRSLKPPGGNTRPEGIAESWSALAARGELPERY